MSDLPRNPIYLWSENLWVEPDRESVLNQRVSMVDNPSMIPFWPDASIANGAAVLIFPGGGYERVAIGHEGEDVARWLNELGIAAFVVKYRLQEYGYPAPQLDGLRAMQYLRANAQQWRLDPQKLGVMGFSAGGHIAAGVAAGVLADDPQLQNERFDAVNTRPDFAILAYPVITFGGEDAHADCRKALFGDEPDPALVRANSLQCSVKPDIPPTFIVHGVGDKAVSVSHSLMFFSEIRKHNSSSELHLYQTKQHGFGLGAGLGSVSAWPAALSTWLMQNGIITERHS